MSKSASYFEEQYRLKGMRSQRSYPNEQLIQFLAHNWFSLPIASRRNIRILEVGCGSGANLWMIAKEGFSAFGIDSSPTAIELAADHLVGKWDVSAELKCGTVTTLPYEDGYFDAVVDIVTLQHLNLEDTARAFAEISRVLKSSTGKFFSYRLSDHSVIYLNSGGSFIDSITVDNITDRELPLNNNGTTTFWSPGLAQMEYARHGLTIESIERFSRTYNSGRHYIEYLAITAFHTAACKS